jgi:phosphoribosylamine--glycine ligase
MRVLVVGGGGREHAIAWALARHGHEVIAAPGNPGISAAKIECVPIAVDQLDAIAQWAAERKVDLVVVGPEGPLVVGLADRIQLRGIPCFGPTQAGARLEGSKAWSKELFARHGIPTAEFAVCASMREVDAALARLGDAVVVKADGLAAGKGVTVCKDVREARAAAATMIEERVFGDAGARVVIERRLPGRECSIHAVTDGRRVVILPPAEDHKAVFDGDRGPNTGGMGVVSPTPVVSAQLLERVRREVLEPTVRGLAAEGIAYRGVLYAGLMVHPDGTPNLLEYNCRFGDPETEAMFPRFVDDPAPWLLAAAKGELGDAGDPRVRGAAVTVILASHGYPAKPRTGDEIHGVDEAAAMKDVIVFHAGTRREGSRLLTAGGRVLAVTALGDDVSAARARAYEAVGKIHWDGMHYRRDIGARRSE